MKSPQSGLGYDPETLKKIKTIENKRVKKFKNAKFFHLTHLTIYIENSN